MAEGVPAGCSSDTGWLHLKPKAKASTQTREVLLLKLGLETQMALMCCCWYSASVGFGQVS